MPLQKVKFAAPSNSLFYSDSQRRCPVCRLDANCGEGNYSAGYVGFKKVKIIKIHLTSSEDKLNYVNKNEFTNN